MTILRRCEDVLKTSVSAGKTQTMSDDHLIGELERVIEKEKPKGEDDIVFALPKIPEILNNKDFEQKQEIKKTTGLWNK